MSIQGKEVEKEQTLNQKLYELIDNDEESYIDLEITCYKEEDDSKKILDNVPPI